MQGYQAVSELLRRAGHEVVFALLGGSNAAWVAHGVQQGTLRLIKTRHEDTACNGAMGYARSTGRTGVFSVTRGPGFANCINALRAAAVAHTPLLMLVGESPAVGVNTEQNIDQRALAPILGVGFHHAATPAALETTFWAAEHAARFNGTPQVLSIADAVMPAEIPAFADAPPPSPLRPQPDAEAVATAIDALAAARSPLILAGQGAQLAGCRAELEELADLVGARVATTLRAHRFFAGHPRDLGLCGSWAPEPVKELLAEVDVVLAVGAALSRHTTAEGSIWRAARVIHCEVDPDRPFRASSPELALLGDARATARALIAEWHRRGLPARQGSEEVVSHDAVLASLRRVELPHDPERGLDIRDVYAVFDALLPDDRIAVTDTGSHLGPMAAIVRARDGLSWVLSRGYGSIGLGLGAAIGAAAAHPGRPVVLFCGDGGFMMASHDLDAVGLNGLDVAVVIMNDEMFGSEVRYLAKYGLPIDTIRQPLPDIVRLAEAFGGSGTVVRTEAELAAVKLTHQGLELVDVRLDPQVQGNALL